MSMLHDCVRCGFLLKPGVNKRLFGGLFSTNPEPVDWSAAAVGSALRPIQEAALSF